MRVGGGFLFDTDLPLAPNASAWGFSSRQPLPRPKRESEGASFSTPTSPSPQTRARGAFLAANPSLAPNASRRGPPCPPSPRRVCPSHQLPHPKREPEVSTPTR